MVKELELDNQLIRCSRCFLSLRRHQEQELELRQEEEESSSTTLSATQWTP